MNPTVALTGMLPLIVLISAALTAVASAFLLWLYRRAVLRSMGALAGAGATPASRGPVEAPRGPLAAPLAVVKLDSPGPTGWSADSVSWRATTALRQAARVYAAGGLAYAVIMAVPWMVGAGNGFVLARFLALAAFYAWPVVLAVNLVAATTQRERVAVAGAYFDMVIGVAAYGLVRNEELTIGQLAFLWLFANAPGTVLLLAFLNWRVRAVGPLVLAFMVAGVTGAFLFITMADRSDRVLRVMVEIGWLLGLGATALFTLMHVAGFAVFAVLGWWGLRWIGRRYRAKRMSDESITLDALWLLFAVVQSITLAFQGVAWVFTGVAAFAVYKAVTRAGFARLARSGQSPAPVLLLLRVFALGRRSERLFEALAKRWRRIGSITLIAGPDLLTRVVEPHEFLEFAGGRLSRLFVRGTTDLEARVAELHRRPDPDGRFRVNDFFCHADTWQMTMRRLAVESHAVLMDLRSFSPVNRGCRYELEQVLGAVPLDRVVFVVDESTDRAFLERTLQELWQRVPATSPNRTAAPAAARLFEARGSPDDDARALVVLLTEGASAGPAMPRLRTARVELS